MRLAPHVLRLLRIGSASVLLTAGCVAPQQEIMPEPAAQLSPGAVSPIVTARAPAIVPIPTAPVVVANVDPPQRRRPKTLFLRGYSGVGCGRG